MKIHVMMLAAAFLAAGCCSKCCDKKLYSAVSPDGRNEIRLCAESMKLRVMRDGKIVVKSKIGMKVDGKCLTADNVRLVATNDGVAYRFVNCGAEGESIVNCERCSLKFADADANALVYRATKRGCEEEVPTLEQAGAISTTKDNQVYLPITVYTKDYTLSVSESDVLDYPSLYFSAKDGELDALFSKYPKEVCHWGPLPGAAAWSEYFKLDKGGRFIKVLQNEEYLTKTSVREFPWRTFTLVDSPSKLVEKKFVDSLVPPAKGDFSWVKPGKVAWDWWNAFDNKGDPEGCTEETYRRFIDFAAANGVEYVIMDEGWSDTLNIWKFRIDVPSLIEYAKKKNVGIILWMAWAQIYGDEEHVAEHFAKYGIKGFKVDFMDRADAVANRFLEKFAAACAKHKLIIDYHGTVRPTGLHVRYPNIINYEGIHGLEQMKFYGGEDMMFNDVACVFGRLAVGPMDYTPGAMDNYPVGTYMLKNADKERKFFKNPGSEGTRVHQMAMMAAYYAPLQMLSDSPTKYEKNMECFSFMAKVPVKWTKSVGLGGCPATYVALARQAEDGSWYVSALNNRLARDIEIDFSFLGEGTWKADIFRDAPDSDKSPTKYVHESKTLDPTTKLRLHLAPGGGYTAHISR